jgi:CheY-like chemotaxis protein
MEEAKRILVADDDASIRHLLGNLARREKLAVDCVSDGIEAIEKLRQNEYAVILLDLMMPRMDGFEVIEYLRAHPGKTKPVVLVITAYADQKFKEVDPSVVAGVIRKPFEVSEIGFLIRLCALGLEDDAALQRMLDSTRDRAVRDFLKLARSTMGEPAHAAGEGERGH